MGHSIWPSSKVVDIVGFAGDLHVALTLACNPGGKTTMMDGVFRIRGRAEVGHEDTSGGVTLARQ